uniref:Polygalacturonase n=1 Tax=Arundo donax TaxID=35708 RepID=A0A0A9EY08_ARUDO
MELAARTAIALLLASTFLCDGVHGRHHHTQHTGHNSARPPSHAPGPRRAPPHARATPPAPPPSAYPAGGVTVYDVVKDFGAVGDGVTDDTDAIKTAWDTACQDDGPGVVRAAAGYSFLVHTTVFTGPCQGTVTIQLDGTIIAPSDPNTWPANSKRNWLVFYQAHGTSLRGAGLIDGKGQKWWDLPCKPHKGGASSHGGSCDSPVALRFFMSNNVTVQGLKVQNSPEFHFRFDSCRGVLVSGLSISSPANSPNTDGIHVENTQDVLIANTAVSNGDDCVSIGAGTLNIHIENVTCGPGHGISIGSLGKQGTRACVANVTVRNAVIRHSDNGVRIKTWQGGSGSVSSVSFENVRMDAVRNPIVIDQYYCLSHSCENSTTAVFVSGVSYAGIRGTYDVRSPPIHFGCSDAVPCTNITLSDVELLPASGETVHDPFCWNVYGNAATPTVPPVACLMEGVPRNVEDNSSLKCY